MQQPEAETEEGLPIDIDSPASTKIELWDYMEAKERLALMDSVEEFSSQNPGVDIEVRHIRSQEELLDQFEAASLAGSGPEVAIVDLISVQRMAESNVIKEITDVEYSIFLEGLAEISGYNGKNYIVPFRATDFLLFYYNRDYAENAFGDFEAVVEYCREVNDLGEQIYGFGLNLDQPDWIIPFIGGYSTWIIDYANYSLSLDTLAMEKTIDFLQMLYDQQEPLVPQGIGYEEMDAMFKNGN
ncbi:MAG: extracellular solute-binding protein, partial [Actinomycetota bacterium]